MEKEQEQQIYKDAIEFFGDTSQKIMVIEEMSELSKELCKELRQRCDVSHIAEELADVEITLAQIKMIYGIHQAVEEQKDFKLNRFARNMAELKKAKSQQP